MPQVRFSISALGQYLEPKIESFIMDNVKLVENKRELSSEDGSKIIANAIAYGISLSLSSPILKSAFSLGIAPPPVPPAVATVGGPVGSMINSALQPNLVEV
jgi:hypothetical protein